MARPWDKGSTFDGFDDTDGGEATPRPLKSRRLLDVMGDASTERGGKSSAVREAPRRGSGSTIPRGSPRPACVPDPAPISRKVSAQKQTDEPIGRKASTKKQADEPISRKVSAQKQTDEPIGRKVSTKKQTEELSSPAESIPSLSSDACAVLSVTPAGEGETVNVVLAMPAETGEKPLRFSFLLLVEQYADLGVQVGEVTPERAEALLEAGRLCGAIRRGIAMLGYADHSARRLICKLTAKGVDRETAEAAVAYLSEKGCVREESAAARRVRQGLDKGWGERRIGEDLFAHGFSRDVVEEALAELNDVDWVEACAAAIRKRYREIPRDRGELQKLMAAMMRMGYDSDTVRSAMREILKEN